MVSLTSHQPGSYLSGQVTLSGVARDDKEITSLSITLDGGTNWQSVEAIDAEEEQWSFPLDTESMTDGRIRVLLRAGDGAGKVTITDELVFSIDNTAPVLLVTGPRDYGTRAFNTLVSVDVAASDVHPIKHFGIEIFDESGNALGDPVEVEQAASPWSFVFRSDDYYPAGFDPESGEFRFTVYVYAEDDAGNVSTRFYHTDDVRQANNQEPLTAAQLASILFPNAGITGRSAAVDADTLRNLAFSRSEPLNLDFDESLDRPQITLTAPNIRGSEPYSVPMNATINGSARDDDAVAADFPKLKLWREGVDEPADWVDLREAGDTSTPEIFDFEYTLPADEAGQFRLSIAAEDVNGVRTVIEALPIVITTGAPKLDITSPANGSFQSGTFGLEGTAEHDAGPPTIDLSFDDGENYDSGFSTTATGDVWDFSVDTSSFDDGSYTLRVRATSATDVENSESISLTFDNTPPTVSITQPADGSGVNGIVELRGTADDNIQVARVEYLDPASGSWELFGTEANPQLYSWSTQIDTGSLTDGDDVELRVRVTDRGGNQAEAAATVTVTQAGDAPVVGFTNIDAAGDFGDNVFTGSATVLGTVSDDDWVDASSIEIRSRYQATQADPWSTWSSWDAVTSTGSNSTLVEFQNAFSAAVEGFYQFELRATDSDAGDRKLGEALVTTTTAPIPFVLDSSPPAVTVDTITGGIESGGVITTRESLTLEGSASDTMGVSTVEYRVTASDGSFPFGSSWTAATTDPAVIGPGVTTLTWDFAITVGGGGLTTGEYSLEIRAVDGALKQGVVTRQIAVDTVAPTISLQEPIDGASVNGTVTIRGVSDDNNQVARSYYWIGPNGDAPPTLPTVSNNNGWSEFGQAYGWSAAWDTYAYQQSEQGDFSAGAYTLHVVSRDNAGNLSSVQTADVTLDQSTDRPSIAVSNLDEAGTGVPSPEGTAPDNLLTGSALISGTISDDDGVDGASIEVRFQSYDWGLGTFGAWGAWMPVDTSYAGVRTSGSWSHDAAFLGEGVHQIQIRAVDTGFAAVLDPEYDDQDNFNWERIGQIAFAYDAAVPAAAVTGPAEGSFHNANFQLTGTASDANGVSSVEVDDGSGFAGAVFGTGTWTLDRKSVV